MKTNATLTELVLECDGKTEKKKEIKQGVKYKWNDNKYNEWTEDNENDW